MANGRDESADDVGRSYVEWADTDGDALAAAAGVEDVIDGTSASFTFAYVCHGPDVERWFQCIVVPLERRTPRPVLSIHMPIGADTADRLQRGGRYLPPSGRSGHGLRVRGQGAERHRRLGRPRPAAAPALVALARHLPGSARRASADPPAPRPRPRPRQRMFSAQPIVSMSNARRSRRVADDVHRPEAGNVCERLIGHEMPGQPQATQPAGTARATRRPRTGTASPRSR